MATGKSLVMRAIQPTEVFIPIEGSEVTRKQRRLIKKLMKKNKK